MTLRDKRQKEFAKEWLNNGMFGILNLCPRFGKIRTTIHILKKLPKSVKILIAYPDNKIKDSWISDFEEMNYVNDNITYTTHLSLKKHRDKLYDLIVIDEIHLLSIAQMEECKYIFTINEKVLGLTGTLSEYTKEDLYCELGLNVISTYTIEEAIRENVIADYKINVIRIPLDDKILIEQKSGKKITEKKKFDNCTYVINKLQKTGKDTMFLRLNRMRIIQNSLSKLNETKRILNKYKDDRILVFCGVTKTADALGIPSYHSKSTEKNIFQDFVDGKGKHLAVVKIGNTGVTYKPLNKIIINYFDSNAENLAQKINRCMAMEYSNPDKKSHIYIISTNEPTEQNWLNKALEFFDDDKIHYSNEI